MSLFFLGLAASLSTYAQAPTGTISGTVTDQSGAVIPNASVVVTNKATGAARTLTANTEGLFSAPALPAGQYQVRASVEGFRTLERDAEVLAGGSTTVNMALSLGATQEVVNVEAATAQINYEANTIQGVVPRQTIQDLPLNGRNFMQLSALEPGVIVAPTSGSTQNYPFTVSILGGLASKTVFTIDGMDIDDDQQGGTGMNFSAEVIQEFQVSSLNYDMTLSTGGQGAVNVVTRSGSNDFHGSAFFFFRDHNMAAYPALKRSTVDPHPFFARRNPGVSGGGPILKDKLFFFGTFETTNQVSATVYQPDIAVYSPLTSIKNSPAHTKFASARFDYHLSAKHNLFLRYSHDGNNSTGAPGATTYQPSAWANNSNWSDQAVLGITSILTPSIVNDLRFGWWQWHNWALPLTLQQCDTTCPGGEIPGLSAFGGYYFHDYMPGITTIGSGNSQMGQYTNAPNVRLYKRPQIADIVSWQKGTHRFKFGADITDTILLDHYWGFSTPLETQIETITSLGSQVSPTALAAYFPNLPTKVRSTADLLNEPNYNISSAAYGVGIGAGVGQTVAPYHTDQHNKVIRPHGFFADTWKVTPRFTLNYGLSYEVDFGLFNSDMPKPAYLVPILGSTKPTDPNLENFSPSVGFAWNLDKSGKTVIRGGGGIYWDTINQYYHWREEAAIGPLGNGRFVLSPNAFTNIYPNIYSFAGNPNGTPLPVGAPLPLNAITNMTLGQYLNLVMQQLGGFLNEFHAFGPYQTTGPITTSSIEYTKQGYELDLPNYPQPRSYQMSVGVQRDLGHDMVATIDYARRLTVHQIMPGEVDYNHFNAYVNGAQTPAIPKCTPASYLPGPQCSNGAITVWDPNNRAVYNAMLVKVSKRLSNRYQFVASYAYQANDTVNAQVDLNNLFGAGYGDILARHNLNISGLVNLPWGFSLTVNSSIISRTPASPLLAGVDINGSGAPTANTLPGLPYNCLNDGCSKSQLAAAVDSFNSTYAAKKTPNGTTIPKYVVPSDYQFGDPTYAQDFRLTKSFAYKERYRLNVFAEMFNSFNVANLTGYSFNLDRLSANPATQNFSFGQPTTRALGTFGSGGPRALQLGARFLF
ncbi:MAG TPA: carboxypeptidase regulatory-like domain-containing protein [Bryobacteraceae bacterium]|nr:carboxypeptidase regulatory-like domain-containing protein [Bryobacteraceae bacterium]